MMRCRRAAAAGVLLASCSAGEPEAGDALSNRWTTTRLGVGDAVSMSSSDASPKVWMTCGDGGADLWFTFAHGPASPPPLRGIYAEVRVDREKPRIFEMGWAPPATWVVRTDSSPVDAKFAQRFAQARRIEVDDFGGGGGGSWEVELDEGSRRNFARACS